MRGGRGRPGPALLGTAGAKESFDECLLVSPLAFDLDPKFQIATYAEHTVNLETSGGVGTGGLFLPTMCIDGPAVGGPGIYRVTIVWRGSASITNMNNNACGDASGNYGALSEFRRIVQMPTFIDPNF